MKKTKIISSPKMDYRLSPSEPRRYSNHILVWFVFLFGFFFLAWQFFIFHNEPLFVYTVAVMKQDKTYLQDFNYFAYFFKLALCIGMAYYPSVFLTSKLTKAVTREEHLDGNFIDDTPEVLVNLSNDFKKRANNQSVSLIKKDENDLNKMIDNTKSYTRLLKPVLIKQNLFIPKDILELSWIIRGEAGSGKTVLTDRLLKETIEAGHKVVAHNVKGDELEKLTGYCPLYLIEPWNEKAGYAINFLGMVARKREVDRNAYIKALVESFSKKDKNNPFFSDGAIEVLFAVIKKVVEDEMQKTEYKATLQNIVDLWNSFNADTSESEIDLTDPQQMMKKAEEKNQALVKIKSLMVEKNPTQGSLIDPDNAKTSLCILATCTKTVKKFEVLAKFWGNRELTKSFDIEQWLANKEDRQVLLLSNSNIYVEEAEAYISAVVNLLTMFVINTEYKPTSELHFILDEFPQLSAINLKQFMKLPDVGRGKKVRVKIVMQRTSQIKEQFDVDPNSFAGAFQNKIWARMAVDDFQVINSELGKRTVLKLKSSANFNKDGQSSNNSGEEKPEDVINPASMQKELGPVEVNGIFQGVRVLFNFSMTKRIAVATLPPVNFPKKKKRKTKTADVLALQTIANAVGGSTTSAEATEPLPPSPTQSNAIETVLELLPSVESDQVDGQAHENDPIGSAVLDIASHTVLPEPIAVAMQVVELMEAFDTPTNNSNTIAETSTETPLDDNKAKMLAILNKNKKKDRGIDL